jgi:hypothetical protein
VGVTSAFAGSGRYELRLVQGGAPTATTKIPRHGVT